jgi:hypothetical protein
MTNRTLILRIGHMMTLRHSMRALVAASALSALAALPACHRDAPMVPSSLTSTVAKGTVQVMVLENPSVSPDTQSFTVHVVTLDVPLAAFQGALTFNARAFTVYDVQTPDPVGGEYRVANAATAAVGRIRFAAFAPDHFASDVVFTVRGRLTGSAAEAQFDAALDVAGETKGARIPATRLVRAGGARDAASGGLLK